MSRKKTRANASRSRSGHLLTLPPVQSKNVISNSPLQNAKAMKTLISLLILLISLSAAYGQRTGKLVFWSGDPGCGQKSRAIAADDKFTCSSVQTDRGPVSTITHNGVSLAVAFLEDDNYNIVGAGITNNTTEPLFFDADMWGAAHFRKKEDLQARKKPVLAETSIPTRDILKNMAVGVKQESSLDTFIADGQKTVVTKDIRKSDGTRERRDVIVPDTQTQEAVARQNDARYNMVMSEQRRIRETALTAKSVQPGQSLKGLVYFRRVKNVEFVVFSLSLDGTTYVFQLPKKQK